MTNYDVESLFYAAIEFSSESERISFLDQACGEDLELRRKVEKLLLAHKDVGEFLEQSPSANLHNINIQHEETLTRVPSGSAKSYSIDNLPCQFGDYELLEKIAQGGMGVVFRARQMSLNRNVAIKMILSGQFAGPEEVKRFHVEAEAAGDLDHPGIVPIFDVGCHQDRHYFSMAFVEGESLAARIKREPCSPREAASLACKLCDAIQAAHEKGIVHRDLKPGNVLLDSHGEPRITDFGLAKRVQKGSELTRTGMVLGTPSYMPPEQASGNEIDSSADIYSLGAILYAMVTGTAPFSGSSQLETIMMVLEDEPTSLRQHSKTIPKDLDSICLKCLEKKPRERYRSASELASDLKHFLAGEPVEAKNGLRQRIRKWTIREPALAAHIAATLVLIPLLVINYWFFGHRGPGLGPNLQGLGLNLAIVGSWALVLFGLQKTQNVAKSKLFIPITWSACNPLFLTMTLAINSPPRELLLSLYFLLIATSCFFRRVDLVIVSTLGSLIGFCALVIIFYDEMKESPAYLLVFGANLMVVGTILGFLTLRMKRLGEQNRG